MDARQYGLSLTQTTTDAFTSARAHQEKADIARKRAYDAAHHPVHFEEGTLVLLYLPIRKPGLSPKLSRHYDGPYRVVRKIYDILYELRHLETAKVTRAHVKRIQPFFLAETAPDPDAIPQASSDDQDSASDRSASPPAQAGSVPRSHHSGLPLVFLPIVLTPCFSSDCVLFLLFFPMVLFLFVVFRCHEDMSPTEREVM